MKKTWFAVVFLAALLGLSVASSLHLDRLTEDILSDISLSRLYADGERYTDAESVLLRGLTRWENADLYTGIVLRHDQTEEVQDLFWDIVTALRAEDGEAASGEYEKLRCHLINLRKMEQIRLQSIL